jgi:hypothetical protein
LTFRRYIKKNIYIYILYQKKKKKRRKERVHNGGARGAIPPRNPGSAHGCTTLFLCGCDGERKGEKKEYIMAGPGGQIPPNPPTPWLHPWLYHFVFMWMLWRESNNCNSNGVEMKLNSLKWSLEHSHPVL